MGEEFFFVGKGCVQGWFQTEGRDGPLPLVVDWRALGGGVIVVGVVFFRWEQVVGRSGDAEGAWHGVLADLNQRFLLQLIDPRGDGPRRRFIRDGLPGKDGLTDVTVLDLIVVGHVREGWQNLAGRDRNVLWLGYRRSLDGEAILKQSGGGRRWVEQNRGWRTV